LAPPRREVDRVPDPRLRTLREAEADAGSPRRQFARDRDGTLGRIVDRRPGTSRVGRSAGRDDVGNGVRPDPRRRRSRLRAETVRLPRARRPGRRRS
jgi:hypothetical protein